MNAEIVILLIFGLCLSKASGIFVESGYPGVNFGSFPAYNSRGGFGVNPNAFAYAGSFPSYGYGGNRGYGGFGSREYFEPNRAYAYAGRGGQGYYPVQSHYYNYLRQFAREQGFTPGTPPTPPSNQPTLPTAGTEINKSPGRYYYRHYGPLGPNGFFNEQVVVAGGPGLFGTTGTDGTTGTGGSTPSTGGSTPSTGGSTPSTGGSTPSTDASTTPDGSTST